MSDVFSSESFSEVENLNAKLKDVLVKSTVSGGFAFSSLTSIQRLVLPAVLRDSKQNSLIKSQTGSGKSICYLVPILHDLMSLKKAVRREDGTLALIISPTRELSSQIESVLTKLTQCCVNVVSGNISGGEKKKNEKVRLRKGLVIVVSTPGRLLDHIENTECFNLQKLRWIVLDEADRLLDMGFGATIDAILKYIRGEEFQGGNNPRVPAPKVKRNTTLTEKWNNKRAIELKKCINMHELSFMMCSATVTSAVHKLAQNIMGGAGYAFFDNDGAGSVSKVPKVSSSPASSIVDGARAVAKAGSGGRGHILYEEKEDDSIIADQFQVRAARSDALDKGQEVSAPVKLRQFYMSVPSKFRMVALASFLRTHQDQKAIIFFATCDSVEYYSLLFREGTWPTKLDDLSGVSAENARQKEFAMADSSPGLKHGQSTFDQVEDEPAFSQVLESMMKSSKAKMFNGASIFSLHGKVPQASRKEVIQRFTVAKSGFLFCTDVVARGIDLPSIKWIVQYDPPCETSDYIHRCGRTARKGADGDALLFLLPSELKYVNTLYSHGLHTEQLSLQKLLLSAGKHLVDEKAKKAAAANKKKRNYDELFALTLQRALETTVHTNSTLLAAGKQCYRSFLRSYTTHSTEMKDVFAIQALQHNHVAKSFGLRESDISKYKHNDVISSIIKGKFADHVINREKTRKAINDRDRSKAKRRKEEVFVGSGGAKKKAKRGEQ